MWLQVAFGGTKVGLATVGYRLYNVTGADVVARTTVGVVEVDEGVYGVNRTVTPIAAVGIEWDTGEGTPVFAHAAISLLERLLRNKLATNPTTGLMTLFDDDNTTPLITGLLFEDLAELQTYRGSGAEVRRRLT